MMRYSFLFYQKSIVSASSPFHESLQLEKPNLYDGCCKYIYILCIKHVPFLLRSDYEIIKSLETGVIKIMSGRVY
jgi:hypothetical protein